MRKDTLVKINDSEKKYIGNKRLSWSGKKVNIHEIELILFNPYKLPGEAV